MAKSRILIVGATGYIGKHVTKASIALGHSTFVLVRPSSASDPSKAQLIESWKAGGATVLHGSLEDYGSLVEAVKHVDIVISAVGGIQGLDQLKLVEAIKEVGTIKRFFPSEFGNDVDNMQPLDGPLKVLDLRFGAKEKVRRATEEAGIPYTYVASHCFAGYFLANLVQPGHTSPPRDKVVIYGDGNAKAIVVDEEDIGTYTIKAADDPRAENKTLYLKPPTNILSLNELVALWEKKIGKTLEKTTLSNAEMLKSIEETPVPGNIYTAIIYSAFVRGDQTHFKIGPNGVEASELYPEVKYVTADAYLDRFL
ncbi:hypothetical protein O6H91_06G091200 [Diphasiastrum complanatum]|uniref:Uncharacterized protein n=2 Tax=Diphasiastrum complanatum TaxID=34168 RepID=A0ACC2DGA0_DIPCM|nr:hypothetical protein O6H91_06G091200 [Diphasiastrum complanatum]